jgi:hypothetical protein
MYTKPIFRWPVMSLKLGSQDMIVLQSGQVVKGLFDKRSSI